MSTEPYWKSEFSAVRSYVGSLSGFLYIDLTPQILAQVPGSGGAEAVSGEGECYSAAPYSRAGGRATGAGPRAPDTADSALQTEPAKVGKGQ